MLRITDRRSGARLCEAQHVESMRLPINAMGMIQILAALSWCFALAVLGQIPETFALEPLGADSASGKGSVAADSQLAPFEFQDNDRVVLLGDTLVERAQQHGYIETKIQSRYPNYSLSFRNFGWSADFPSGESRASFDWNKPEIEWLDRLVERIAEVKPTVVILGYGMANSFAGEDGLPKFKSDLNRLIDGIRGKSEDRGVRFILFSPIRHEHLPPPFPDPAKHNLQLELYANAIRSIAEEGAYRFISLFDLLPRGTNGTTAQPITDNGIHLNGLGYWWLAEVMEASLGWEPRFWRVAVEADGTLQPGGRFIAVEDLQRAGNEVAFDGRPHQLDAPVAPLQATHIPIENASNTLQVAGLNPGTYVLSIDGKPVATATGEVWNRSQVISGGALQEQTQQLRQAIVKKNELFFYQWRPANQTYLFGFRRHEQGRNAREIPMFDPLISEQEARILELKKPLKRAFKLSALSDRNQKESTSATGPNPKSVPMNAVSKNPPEKSSDGHTNTSQGLPAFEIADGFEISLFAENPMLAKPIQINFDPQGRLWVASSSVYPQIEPGQVADDKILILEDTNNDGKADQSTVFADGLLIPTGVEPGDGGAYVGQSTELLHLSDTDGDGKADQRRVVLSGFGTEDTHHIVHTLRWAPDGQLYFNQSVYIHSHIETPHGVVRLNSGGILQLRPATMELNVFLRGFWNSWGHDVDDFGQSFTTDGAGFSGLSYGVPGAMYEAYAGARRTLNSISGGGYPKFCGLELIRSRHFPDDWHGDAITCDFRAHRIVRFSISQQGAGYVTKEMPDLLRSSDVSFRPIDVKLGPDGALYIADWSNPIIQHGEVDFRDPRRDHEHGRIWRVTVKNRPLVPKPALVKAENTDLFNQLLSPNVYSQRQARRVLTERGTSILTDLAGWANAQTSEIAQMRALWMYQAIDVVELNLLKKLLSANDGRIRAAAVRVLSCWHRRLNEPAGLLEKAITDEHPRVRLEAMRALSGIKMAKAAELVLSVLDKPMDRFLDYALWLSINDLAKPWIDSIESGEWQIQGRERQLEFGLQAIEPSISGPVIRRLIETRGIPKDGSGPWIDLVGKVGTAKELRQLYDQVLRKGFDPSAAVKAIESIESAARLRAVKPSDDLGSVSQLLSDSDVSVRTASIRLAGAWRVSELAPRLIEVARDTSVSNDIRTTAFGALREIGGPQVFEGVVPLLGREFSQRLRIEGAKTLAALDLKKGAPLVVEVLSDLTDEAVALDFWRSLMVNRGAAALFADALRGARLPAAVAKTGMRVAREGGRSAPELVLALATSGNLEESAHQLSPEEINEMVANVRENGNPSRGEEVYRRPELACVTCHSIGGVGGKAGPDLTSIGTSAQIDYLIESLLYPNRKIKEGYHSVVVETKDGQEYSGVPVRETDSELIIRDAADREVSIPKHGIELRTVGGSIMPSGLLDAVAVSQQIDLYRFLSELGRPGPFDASKGNVARLWKLFPLTIDAAQFGDDRVLNSSFNSKGWSTALTFADGRLPRSALEMAMKAISHREPSGIYAAAEFQTAESGKINLQFHEAKEFVVWVDGRSLLSEGAGEMEVPAGQHRVVVRLDGGHLPLFLRLEIPEATFVTQ
ncbi:MAG: HEAT repeat domain-containing protein [Verrucomicrobia bacterium]|nr:HEAT repeat domain-containing protein [Verrucomicrobiota bacterium]